MLGLMHLPWRKVIGLALIALLLLPVLDQAKAVPRAKAPASKSPAISECAGGVSPVLARGEGEGDKNEPLTPDQGEGDPNDFGYFPPTIERVLFLLRLIG